MVKVISDLRFSIYDCRFENRSSWQLGASAVPGVAVLGHRAGPTRGEAAVGPRGRTIDRNARRDHQFLIDGVIARIVGEADDVDGADVAIGAVGVNAANRF